MTLLQSLTPSAGKAVVKNSASDLRISHNDAGSVIIGVVRASLSARRIGA